MSLLTQEKDRPSKSAPGQKLSWCPFAKIIEPEMPTKGPYRDMHPRGAIVHYSASATGSDVIAYGRKMGYAYMFIDRAGLIHQAHPLTRWGYHAGPSSWPELGDGVSRYLVGIELEAAGMLTVSKDHTAVTYFGATVPAVETRQVSANDENQQPGWYHVYTPAQEQSLTSLLLWLKSNAPLVFSLNLVLGHDEVAPTRKQDPGGALSMTMPAYRKYLSDRWQSEHGSSDPEPTADEPATG